MELSRAVQSVARSSLAARPMFSLISRSPTISPFRCMFSTGPTRFAPPPPPPPPSAATAEATSPAEDSESPPAPWTSQSARSRLQKHFRQTQLSSQGPSMPPRPDFSGPSLWDTDGRPGSDAGWKSLRTTGLEAGSSLDELVENQRKAFLANTPPLPGTFTRFDGPGLRSRKKTEVEMRLCPSTGRTIYCRANADVGRAFDLLNRSITRNKVRVEVYLQRYHERMGLKRKRLRGERWRSRFKKGFQAACKRVLELRNQGW